MINQRQGGRRRGRGGQGGRNLGGQPGNRQDNRQRGNAAQLLEKYKSMARDSQLAGDRVQTEYYLQYADHYFRVLSENRARFEEQSPRRQRDDGEEIDSEEEMAEGEEAEGADDRQPRRERFSGRDRGERRFDRQQRGDGGDDESDSAESVNGRDDSLPLDVLPPSIGADAPAPLAVDAEEAPKPRRRPRTAKRAEGDEEVAPAA